MTLQLYLVLLISPHAYLLKKKKSGGGGKKGTIVLGIVDIRKYESERQGMGKKRKKVQYVATSVR